MTDWLLKKENDSLIPGLVSGDMVLTPPPGLSVNPQVPTPPLRLTPAVPSFADLSWFLGEGVCHSGVYLKWDDWMMGVGQTIGHRDRHSTFFLESNSRLASGFESPNSQISIVTTKSLESDNYLRTPAPIMKRG